MLLLKGELRSYQDMVKQARVNQQGLEETIGCHEPRLGVKPGSATPYDL